VTAETPLVSCVVAVYNGERFLREALDSILAQNYRPLEVIVVDDGSTDGTAAIAAGYGERISLLHQANAGHAAARNRGIEAARGDFLAFLDADDLWRADKLTRQVERFRHRPELDASVTLIQNFWMPELATEAEEYRDQHRGGPLPGYSPVTLLARSSLFRRLGFFDTSLRHGGVAAWFVRAREQGALIELLPEVLVQRRMHARSFGRENVGSSQAEYLAIVKAALDRRRGRRGQQTRLEGAR
jgi:glycosyltransferase involved in cell wall biosynthesis